jgi:hypothetical protein
MLLDWAHLAFAELSGEAGEQGIILSGAFEPAFH